jgi:hypothetical protein
LIRASTPFLAQKKTWMVLSSTAMREKAGVVD